MWSSLAASIRCQQPLQLPLQVDLSFLFDITMAPTGPALMAVWSKAPPLTARCLSPLLGFKSRPGHVRRLPVT